MPAFLKSSYGEHINTALISRLSVAARGTGSVEKNENGYTVWASVVGENESSPIFNNLNPGDAETLLGKLVEAISKPENDGKIIDLKAMRSKYPMWVPGIP